MPIIIYALLINIASRLLYQSISTYHIILLQNV